MNNSVIFTDPQSAIQAIAQMQHHKQPIVTDILTTANKLYNQNDIETFIEWFPGHCDIAGNDRADKLVKRGATKTKQSWQHWVELLPAPTTSKPDRPYQPTIQCSSDCHNSPQNTPCTAEYPPTSHQEKTASKVCLLPRQ